MSPVSPIIVLDSGLGGLTVVRALRALLPHDDILYFGDTARLPYGSKSATTVTTFVKQIIAYLRPHSAKHVVIACNTATALALPAVRGEFPDLSMSGVVEPGARAAVEAAGAKEQPVIGVIATEATIRSKAYERAIHRRRHHARMLLRPTPLLVPIIEEGRDARDPLVRLALKQYLQAMVDRGMDVLLLGCTHYPLLKGLIAQMVGPAVRVIDSAEACAEDVQRRLTSAGLLRAGASDGTGGSLRCFVTDDTPRFAPLASHFLGFPVGSPTWVPPDELYGLTQQTPMRRAV
jgi:glutamate racemase